MQQDEEHVPHYVVAETLSGSFLSSATDHVFDQKQDQIQSKRNSRNVCKSLLCRLQR